MFIPFWSPGPAKPGVGALASLHLPGLLSVPLRSPAGFSSSSPCAHTQTPPLGSLPHGHSTPWCQCLLSSPALPPWCLWLTLGSQLCQEMLPCSVLQRLSLALSKAKTPTAASKSSKKKLFRAPKLCCLLSFPRLAAAARTRSSRFNSLCGLNMISVLVLQPFPFSICLPACSSARSRSQLDGMELLSSQEPHLALCYCSNCFLLLRCCGEGAAVMSPVPSCPTLCPAIPGVPSSSLAVGFAAWDEVSGTRALSTSCALAPAGIIFLSLPHAYTDSRGIPDTWRGAVPLPARPAAPEGSQMSRGWGWGCHPTLLPGTNPLWVEIYPFPLLLNKTLLGCLKGK